MDYIDNPLDNLLLLKSLDTPNLLSFVRGYLLALAHMKESLSGSKAELLAMMLGMEDKDEYTGYLALLDAYEDRLDNREKHLRNLYPEIEKSA